MLAEVGGGSAKATLGRGGWPDRENLASFALLASVEAVLERR